MKKLPDLIHIAGFSDDMLLTRDEAERVAHMLIEALNARDARSAVLPSHDVRGSTSQVADALPAAVGGGDDSDRDLAERINDLSTRLHHVEEELAALRSVTPDLDHQGRLAAPLPTSAPLGDRRSVKPPANQDLNGRPELAGVDHNAMSRGGSSFRLESRSDVELGADDRRHDVLDDSEDGQLRQLEHRRRLQPSAMYVFVRPAGRRYRIETSWLSVDIANRLGPRFTRGEDGRCCASVLPIELQGCLERVARVISNKLLDNVSTDEEGK